MPAYVQPPSTWVEIQDKRNELVSHSVLIFKVCQFYGVTVEDLKSKSKKREFVHARYFCWYFLQKVCSLTLVDIGKKFDKHHTTILTGIRDLKDYIKIYPAIAYEEKLLSSQILN